jgi:hypothetical protein
MNSESYGKLENYLAQYMSATSGRHEPHQNTENTVPIPATDSMQEKSSSNGESSEWSPTCRHCSALSSRLLKLDSLALKTHKANCHLRRSGSCKCCLQAAVSSSTDRHTHRDCSTQVKSSRCRSRQAIPAAGWRLCRTLLLLRR